MVSFVLIRILVAYNKKTPAYLALQFERNIPLWLLSLVKKVVVVIILGILALMILKWLEIPPVTNIPFETGQFFGFLIFLAILVFILFIWQIFLEWLKTPHPQRPLAEILEDIKLGKANIAQYLDFEVIKIIEKSINDREKPVSSLTLENALDLESAQFILGRLGISPEALKKEMGNQKMLQREDFGIDKILLDALDIALERNKQILKIGDILTSLAKNSEFFRKFLFDLELDQEDVKNVSYWQESIEERLKKQKQFWSYENLMRIPGIGRGWTGGYTISLDQFSTDLTKAVGEKGIELHLIGHDREIKNIERILAKAGENNVLLVGEVGVGRRTVIEGLAKMIFGGTTLPEIEYKRVLELNIDSLVAGLENLGQMEERLITIFNEALKARNIILVINQFDNFVGQAYGLGKIDISSIIEPFLGSKYLQVIGISDFAGFHKYIEKNPLIMKFFEKVEVKEPNENEAILILEDVASLIETRHKILVTYQVIREAVKKSDIYIQEIAMPEKAINLLEETAIYAAKQKQKNIILPEDIDSVLTERTGIPIGKMAEEEKEKLIDLEKILHQRLINQEEAVKAIASAMRRARTGIAAEKRPIGSFLFLGPTGVGKTETAKTLAETYFGSEEKMIRLDMSEYQDIRSISRFMGSLELGEPGTLPSAIRENPFSLVLLDEIDKAHPDILNLFLQVLDEGFLTDAYGKKVNFRNTIIIATSNAGAELIRKSVGAGIDPATIREKVLDHIQAQGIFRPEFINRFDGVIVYHPLSPENLLEIAELMLKDLTKRLGEKDIKLVITPELKQKVVELGYEPEFGARPMRRVIQEKIEDLIAKRILSGEIKRGDTITITPEELS